MKMRRRHRAMPPSLAKVREPIRNPGRGKNDVQQVSPPVVRFAECVIRGNQAEPGEHEDRQDKPIVKGQKQHHSEPAAGPTGKHHREKSQANKNAENSTGHRYEIQLNSGSTMTVARMKFAILTAMLVAAGMQAQESSQPFRLGPGDFRWVPFTVQKTPTEVECLFRVLDGSPTVHMELLPMSEFHSFDRGEDYSTIALTPATRTGEFRHVIDTRGRYALVVINAKNAPAAIVALDLRTSLNPNPADVARTLPPHRQLAVILISFAFFFVSVTWSSRKLIRAMRASGR